MVAVALSLVTESGIIVEDANLFMDNILGWVTVASGFILSVLFFLKQLSKMFIVITDTIKGKAETKDVQGLMNTVRDLEHLVREIVKLEEVSALANIDNKYLDEDTKASFANVLNEFNTVETLTKEHWEKIQRTLRGSKE